ncbi:glycosyltransferase [Nocardioides sp. TRM66260-LWL]|uniref:glycosyltransferase n=1 Tax=Nocardioides sp. TRM66260-LWL TaxID=2874478 RepID=UPI001CC81990|nr:glycosyltransferase [Nocardioides sp. TRM66260-LWL]MBZ5734904.1 glycosyltransferase [Nocardioides sp. TRM66260-LWL]
MSRPVVSVVVPCLDAETTLGRQLAALTAQVCRHPFEVIVADNGSTDGSREVAAGFADQGVRVVDASAVRGVGPARDAGVRAARADLVLHCDADDVVHDGWVEALTDALLAGADWVGGTTRHVLPGGALLREETGLRRADLGDHRYAMGGNCGYHRAAWAEMGGFDASLPAAEEVDFFVRLEQHGHHGRAVPAAVLDYVQRDGLRALLRQQRRYGRGWALVAEKHGAAEIGVVPRALRIGGRGAFAIVLVVVGLLVAPRRDRALLDRWARAAFQVGAAQAELALLRGAVAPRRDGAGVEGAAP